MIDRERVIELRACHASVKKQLWPRPAVLARYIAWSAWRSSWAAARGSLSPTTVMPMLALMRCVTFSMISGCDRAPWSVAATSSMSDRVAQRR